MAGGQQAGGKRPPMRKFNVGVERAQLTKLFTGLELALRQRIQDEASCTAACKQVYEKTLRNPEAQVLIGRMDLMPWIQEAMEIHEGSAQLQEAACRAISSVCASAGNASKGRAMLPQVKAGMKATLQSASSQEAACRAISVLAGHPKAREVCEQLKLLARIQQAMKMHPTQKTVQEAACSAVSLLLADSEQLQTQAAQLGLETELQAALKTHSTVPKVVERARAALEHISSASTAVAGDSGMAGDGGGGEDAGSDVTSDSDKRDGQ